MFAALVLTSVFSVLTVRYIRLREPVDLPILMYHNITLEGETDEMTVSAEEFEAQISYLHAAGYETIDFEMLIAFADGKARLPKSR